MSSMFYHDFLSFRTCTTENTPNTISLNYLHTLMKSANFLSVLSNFCGARKWRETNYANQHDRFRSDTDRLLSTWFWLKESETTVCLKTFEKKIGLYCNVRLLLPQSFHTWKHTKMARPDRRLNVQSNYIKKTKPLGSNLLRTYSCLLPCKVLHRPYDCCKTRHTHSSFCHYFLHWTEIWWEKNNTINKLMLAISWLVPI